MADRCVLTVKEKVSISKFIQGLVDSGISTFPMEDRNLIKLIESGTKLSINRAVLRSVINDFEMDESAILTAAHRGSPISTLHKRVSLLLEKIESIESRLSSLERDLR